MFVHFYCICSGGCSPRMVKFEINTEVKEKEREVEEKYKKVMT